MTIITTAERIDRMMKLRKTHPEVKSIPLDMIPIMQHEIKYDNIPFDKMWKNYQKEFSKKFANDAAICMKQYLLIQC